MNRAANSRISTPVDLDACFQRRHTETIYSPKATTMHRTIAKIILVAGLMLTWALLSSAEDNWPSHRGPENNYRLNSETEYPTQWSVANDENVQWKKPLPGTGHSGIAAFGDRLFLTCFGPLQDSDNRQGKGKRTETWVAETRGHCLSADTGEILWSCELPGKRPNQVNGTFTDSTTPTPVTDGKHVWFVSAGGFMACYTVDGTLVWEREFEVRTKHSAKLFQPFLHAGKLYYVMVRDKDDPLRRTQTAKDWDKNSKEGWPWLFVRCFDASTGAPAGILPGGISCHSRGSIGVVNQEPVLLYARGGSHVPPEKPFGLEVAKLNADHDVVWFQPKASLEGTDSVDDQYTYSVTKSQFKVIDFQTGETVKSLPIPKSATATLFDQENGGYQQGEVSLEKWKRLMTHHGNVGFGKHQFFMADQQGLLGRINIDSGELTFLQVPLQVTYEAGQKTFLWDKFTSGDPTSSGFQIQGDRRRLSHGFGHVTAATPIVVNQRIYFTTMLGTVYVIDATAETFDDKALLSVNDFGPAGQTWSLSPITAAGGSLYQRTSKDIIRIKMPN